MVVSTLISSEETGSTSPGAEIPRRSNLKSITLSMEVDPDVVHGIPGSTLLGAEIHRISKANRSLSR